jgi:hypothetical protein
MSRDRAKYCKLHTPRLQPQLRTTEWQASASLHYTAAVVLHDRELWMEQFELRRAARGRLGDREVEVVLEKIAHLEELKSVRSMMAVLRTDK